MARIMYTDKVSDTMNGFVRVMTRANRIITGRRGLTVMYGDAPRYFPNAPGWATENTIYFNRDLVRSELAQALADKQLGDSSSWNRAIVSKLGLNYHELSHILFTPGSQTPFMRAVQGRGKRLFHAWNVMEDQRIEMLFWTMYLPSEPYFTYMILRWVVSNNPNDPAVIGGSYPWVAQRLYLPAKFRARVRRAFIKKYDEHVLTNGASGQAAKHFITNGTELADAIDATLREFFEADFNKPRKSAALCEKFADLLDIASEATNPPGNFDDHSSIDSSHSTKQEAAEEHSESMQELMGEVDEEDEESGEFDGSDADDDGDESDSDADGEGADDGDEDAEGSGSNDEADGGASDGDDGDTGDDGESGDGGGADPHDNSYSDPTTGAGSDPSEKDTGFVQEVEDLIREVLADDMVQEELNATNENIRSAMEERHEVQLPKAQHTVSSVPVEGKVAAQAMIEEIRQLRTGLEEHWVHEERTGRLNVRQAMKRKVVIGPPDVFDDWEPSTESAGGVEAVLLIDKSGSMGALAGPASVASWQIKSMFDAIEMPCTVMAYGDDAALVYEADERADAYKVRFVGAPDGSTNASGALTEAGLLFDKSEQPNRVLFIITDGHWHDAGTSDSIIRAMNDRGVFTVLVHLQRTVQKVSTHNCQVFRSFSDPRSLVPIVKDLVENITRAAMTQR